MCFSAPASFTASGVLAVLGGILLKKIPSKKFLPLALVPCFFAIQQAAEGLVWISLPQECYAKNIFLFFAYVFWPSWIPFSLWVPEKISWRKQTLTLLLGIGIVISLFLFLRIPQTKAVCYRSSIRYLQQSHLEPASLFGLFFYALATVLPFFISSLKKIWILGALITLTGLLTFWVDRLFFVSIWCFFSAILSILLLLILKKNS